MLAVLQATYSILRPSNKGGFPNLNIASGKLTAIEHDIFFHRIFPLNVVIFHRTTGSLSVGKSCRFLGSPSFQKAPILFLCKVSHTWSRSANQQVASTVQHASTTIFEYIYIYMYIHIRNIKIRTDTQICEDWLPWISIWSLNVYIIP